MARHLLGAALAGLFLLSGAGAQAQTVVPITALPSAATPLAGSELLPCVQGGVTKKCLSASLGSIQGTGANAVASASGPADQALYVSGTYTGSGSNPYALINATDTASSSGNGLVGLMVNESFGSAGSGAGNRTASAINLLQTAPTPGSGTEFYTGAFINVESVGGDGGTISAPRGAYYGIGGVATLDSGATYVGSLQEGEFDVSVVAGASVQQKSVLTLVGVNSDAVQGSVYDAMLGLLRDSTTTVGWNYGIAFGRQDAQWPIASGGTMIGSVAPASGSRIAAYGVDLRNITFSGGAFASPGFAVDGSGNVAGISLSTAGASGAVYINSRSGSGTQFAWINQTGANVSLSDSSTSSTDISISSQSTIVSGFYRGGLTTVGNLSTIDPAGRAGDMMTVSDATACTANTAVTGGGSLQCAVMWSGTAWKAIVTR